MMVMAVSGRFNVRFVSVQIQIGFLGGFGERRVLFGFRFGFGFGFGYKRGRGGAFRFRF